MKDLVAKLRIEAEATGEAKIAAMARELEQLAAQGTAAAPAFAELANELRALQAEKGDALGSIGTEIDAVLNAAVSAAAAVDGLSNALEGVAQPDGLADTAGQVGALGSAATGAAPAVDGLSSALAGVAQPDGLADTAGQVGSLGSAASGAAPAVDGLSNALAGVAQPDGLEDTAEQLGSLGSAATGAAPAVDDLSNSLAAVAQPDGLDDTAGQVGSLGSAATGAAPAVDTLASALGDVAQQAGPTEAAGDLRDLGTAAKEAQAGLDAIAIDALAADIQQVGLDKLIAEFDRLAASGGEMAPKFAQAAAELRGLQASAAGLGDTAGKLVAVGRAAATADPAVGSLKRQLGELRGATSGSADALGEMGSAASDARGGVDELAEGAAEAAEAVNQLSGAQPQLEGLAQAIAAIFALAQLKQAAGSAIELADAFGQMDERVRMATAGTAEYEAVQARLLETANNTFRPLAEQQELYIRTADALRSLGLSTEQAVDVTDAFSYLLTTNAASADRAKSAIDAYSKSLASGKVDVDAWMSITTAMPTVVDAIATSMGKSAAEVRKLGVEGALSLAAINTALLQTRDASEQTAATMDATLNDAVQRLQNNWGRYLADLNQTYGVTEKLVGGLVTLSENLDAVGKAAGAAGMVALVAAITAAEIKMYGYIVALKAYIGTAAGAAAATTALTVALGNLAAGTWVWAIYKNSEALEEYRERAVAAELATLNLALNQGRLKDRFEDISRSTGVAVTNMAELNTAVEEGRLHFDELTKSWRAGATSMSAVAEATQHLSAGAQALVEDYYKLREAGKNTADALKGAFKGITNPEGFRGIQAMGEALAELGNTGEVSARQVDDAWRTALANLSGGDLAKFATTASQVFGDSATEAAALTSALKVTAEQLGKMSGTELQQFGTIARKAFEDGRLEAEAFAKINDQVLAASFESLGVNAAQAMGTISAASADAIANLDLIDSTLQKSAASAGQVATALEMAFGQSIAKADSLEAIAELEKRLKTLAEAGKVGAEGIARINAELDKQRAKIEDQIPGIQSLEEAYRELGLKSAAELKALADKAKLSFEMIRDSGKATPEILKAAFTEYAERAIEANGGVVDALLQQEAGQVGLRVEADKTGKVIVKTFAEVATEAAKVTDETKKAAGGIKEMGSAADEASKSLLGARKSAADAVETTKGGSAAWLDAAQSASKFAGAAKDAGDRAYQAALAMGNAGGSIESWTRYLGSAIEAAQGAAAGYISMMESLEAQQAKLTSGGAQGLEDLKLRWLELNGTEEQIAAARQARDEANIQRQIALLQIDAKRAALNGDSALAKQLRDEIALMKEQLVWLDKIFKEEERQRREREREAEKEEKRRAREQRDRERERNKSSDESDSDSSPTPSRPSSNAGGGNLGGTPNNNTGNRPPVANGPVVNITLNPGANLSDRAEVERLARLIAPELQNLSRRGF